MWSMYKLFLFMYNWFARFSDCVCFLHAVLLSCAQNGSFSLDLAFYTSYTC